MSDIDHRVMVPPFLRVAEQRTAVSGAVVYQWDFRIAQPNVSVLSLPVIHSLEHFLGSWLRLRNEFVVTVAPMGCQTGFYITAIDIGCFDEMAELVAGVLVDVIKASAVPLADPTACGQADCHSLVGAQRVAEWLLARRAEWKLTTLEVESFGCP